MSQTPSHTPAREPDPALSQLLAELTRAHRMEAAAWQRYLRAHGAHLTSDDLATLQSHDNVIRGRRPVDRTPPA